MNRIQNLISVNDTFIVSIGMVPDSQEMDTAEIQKNCNVLFAVFCLVLCRVAVLIQCLFLAVSSECRCLHFFLSFIS